MPSLARLVNDAEAAESQLLAAEIHRAPAALEDELTVIVASLDDQLEVEIRRWMPRGAALPAAGDAALIGLDDSGEPWLVAWSPA